MGRREGPVDPSAGPVQRFAHDLRKLRTEAGGPPYRTMARGVAYSPVTLSRAAAGEQLPSLNVTLAYVEACGGDPVAWEARWHEVSREHSDQIASADDSPSPYPGLARFHTAEQAHFHGREELTARLTQLALSRPLTIVVGASGCGKSSLLHAGLVPALRDRGQGPNHFTTVQVLTPGQRPAHTHRARFTPVGGGGRTLLVVDQFEELYTLCHDPAERIAFLDLLLAARHPARRLSAVLAVRADFSGRCAEYGPFAEALRDAALLVGPLTPHQLREAVIRPAATRQVIVERALTARIVSDTDGEPGGLPLMAHALREVWRRRAGRRLTEAAYDAIGGIHGAVAHTAEETCAAFTVEEAAVARALLLRLVAPGDGTPDTRRRAGRAELNTSPTANRILESLITARLLTTDGDEIELAHEALLTAWPRFRTWIDEDRERLRRHRHLTDAARAWLELDRDPGALYRGVRLALARQSFTDATDLTDGERAFLTAGVEALRREERAARRAVRRLRSLTGLLAALLVTAVLAGTAAWQQSRAIEKRRDESEARRIAAVAATLRTTDPRVALRLGVAAYRIADLPETREAVRAGAGQSDHDLFTPALDQEPVKRQLSPDGTTLTVVVKDRLMRWDIASHRHIADDRIPGEEFFALAPDSGVIASWDSGHLVLRRAPDGREVRIPLGAHRFDRGFFSPDGQLFVVGDNGGGLLQVRDTRTGKPLFTTRNARNGGPPYAVTNDNRLVAWCNQGRLMIHDLTGRTVHAPPRDLSRAACMADEITFTPDSRAFAAPTPNSVRTWDLRSGRERPHVPARDAENLAFSPSGDWLTAHTSGTVRIWRTHNPGSPVYISPPVNHSVYEIRVDERVGMVRYREGRASVTTRTLFLGRTLETTPVLPQVREIRLSPDGRLAVTSENGRPMLRNAQSGALIRRLPSPTCRECPLRLAFSPRGDALAYATGVPARDLRVVSTATGRTLWTARLSGAESLVVGPGGSFVTVSSVGIVVNGEGDHLRLMVWRFDQHGSRRLLAADIDITAYDSFLAPDLRTVLTTDGRSHSMDAGPTRPATPGERNLESVSFSADGQYLAVGDYVGRVTLWNRGTGERLAVLQEQENGRPSNPNGRPALAFSSDGTQIAVGLADGSIRVWETAAPQLDGALVARASGPIRDLVVVDGRVRAATADTASLSYDVGPPALARATCAHSGELTRREWTAYMPGLRYRKTC
ncbi:WD40 repeat domain-containing protein [Streptomyces yaizuensis]|uniref:PD40 domain-containing protein n=1 Tax=Streptomyces yaizuensis TaxID=2989713 RepID=A0ABQ5NX78_9ACTN|nr:WD40 repeat domain-containing protein [Streptomyces sp. YSPA8]GLF94962.1 PD40 domain-containing protein [Streptomyces sp. YSPA8]